MTRFEQQLLNLADRLRLASSSTQLRAIRADIEALAPQARVLDLEQPAQAALRRLYNYLDARSAAAVHDRAAQQRAEHAEIERRLLGVITEFRRSVGGMEMSLPRVEMHALFERIDALERGSDQRWMLERLYEYADWQRRCADARGRQRMTRSLHNRTATHVSDVRITRNPQDRDRGRER